MSKQNNTTQFTPEELNNEEWRPVPGYEGVYSVSNFGRIRRDVAGRHTRVGRIRTPGVATNGYCFTILFYKSIPNRFYIHNLVAMAFIGHRPENFDINHINGIKTDNRPSNLEYVTHRDNILHAMTHGLWGRTQTQCSRGHEMIGDNIYYDKNGQRKDYRECRKIRNAARKRKHIHN